MPLKINYIVQIIQAIWLMIIIFYKWNRSWFVELKRTKLPEFSLFIRNRTYLIGQTVLCLILALLVAFSAFQVGNDENSVRATLTVLYYTAVFFQFFPFIPFLFVCHRDKLVLQKRTSRFPCESVHLILPNGSFFTLLDFAGNFVHLYRLLYCGVKASLQLHFSFLVDFVIWGLGSNGNGLFAHYFDRK